MANYTTVDGYKFDAQINYGWGLTLNMTGKAPEVSKRIFDTYEHMLYYVNDYNDSCIEGLCLKVMADGDKNGVYFVTKIGTNKPAVDENGDIRYDDEGNVILSNTFANDGEVVKLGNDARIIAAEAEIQKIKDTIGEIPSGTTIADMFISEEEARNAAIKAAIEGLYVAEMAEDGKYVSKVSEVDGKVSVEFKTIEAAEVTVADNQGQFAGATVEAVLAEIQDNLELSAQTLTNALESAGSAFDEALDSLSGTVDSKMSAEHDARVEAEGKLQDAINDEIEAREEAISALTKTHADDKAALEKAIEAAAEAAKAAHSKVVEGTDAGNHMNIVQTEGDGGEAIYTINLTDVASASDVEAAIAAEKKAREDADAAEKKAREEAISALTKTHADDKAALEKVIDDEEKARIAKDNEITAQMASDKAELNNAITAETQARKEAVSAETEARKEAISAEEDARKKAVKAEEDARIAADNFLSGRIDSNYTALTDMIESVSSDAKSYSVATVSGDELKGLGENVLEAYKLVDEDGTKAGEYIKIYKDSALKSVALSGQELVFVYQLADGKENTVKVDVSAFLHESEYGNGLQVVEHVVSVKRDDASENFLSVSENGIKVSGVQTAINTAVNAEKERAMTAESALTDAINAEKDAREDAIESLSGTVDTIVDELEQDIEDAKAAAIAASTKIEKDVNAVNLTLTSVTAENGSITYTIGQTDIASASGVADAIAAEKKAREDADAAEVAAREALSGAMDTKINAEIAAREALSGAMDTKINAEVAAREALSGAMDTKINAEKERAMAAESALTDAINAEKKNREDADKALSDRLTALESGENSVAKQIETAVTAEKNRAETVEAELRADVNTVSGKADQNAADIVTERKRAMAAESGLSNAISAETEARKAAISGVTAQMAADKAELEKAIEDEISARTNADQALSDRLDAIEAVQITGKDAIVVSANDATANKEVSLKLVEKQLATDGSGIELTQDEKGLKATLYWGEF